MAATGQAPPRPFPGDPSVCAELVLEHKLTREEYEKIVGTLGRPPSYTELGVFSVMWSEHCSYKSSRVHLKRLPTTGPRVIQGPGENAGVVDIGDGFCAVFKMESHNHPSFIEPYQGAATGVGGILRDVFTMGARPIASLDSLRFGRPDHPRTAELLRGVVAGIGGYGNSIGVPTVGGEVMFDERYDGNILVNAFTCGVARTDKLFFGRATGVGNDILYIGAKTGRDGIHGATMASDEFSQGGPSQRPTMQVGDPFMGKLLLEACLELFGMDVLEGIQDMGAAGLTSSSVEMAGRAQNGIEIDLDLVPRRAKRMTPYEILLSESQERMLLVAKPGQAERVLAVCKKWDLDAAVIGRVTDTKRWVVKATPGFDPLEDHPARRASVVVCDLPIGALTDDAPSYDRPRSKRKMETDVTQMSDDALPAPADLRAELLDLLASPNIGSRRWIWRQYDHVVRGGTVVRPGSDAAVVRVPCREGLEKYLAFSVDCNARHAELDPFVGGALAVAEACRNLVCSGAEPIGLTDCLNFGNPERPEVMDSFSRAVSGIAAACNALAVPIVSGNVSLYNETDGRPILPTPAIAAVGLVRDPADVVTQWFKGAGHAVVLLGRAEASSRDLGGSEYLTRKLGRIAGDPPLVDLPSESNLQKLVLELARAHLLASAHDVSDGGLAVALAECCTTGPAPESDTGARIDIPAGHARAADVPAYFFGEAAARAVVSVLPEHVADVIRRAEKAGVPAHELGVTGGDSLSIALVSRHGEVAKAGACVVPLREIRARRESCLEGIVGA
jgi:phosphoribosylformylglycinamidine synthase subunit PurL